MSREKQAVNIMKKMKQCREKTQNTTIGKMQDAKILIVNRLYNTEGLNMYLVIRCQEHCFIREKDKMGANITRKWTSSMTGTNADSTFPVWSHRIILKMMAEYCSTCTY